MQADVHAFALIGLPVAVVAALAAGRRRAPTRGQLAAAFAVAAAATLAAPLLNHHLCNEGTPRSQWMILGPCLLALVLVEPPAWRRGLGALVLLGMMGLSWHFTALVHRPGWTGNPGWDGGAGAMLASLRTTAAAVAADSADPTAYAPAGWLRDLPLWPAVRDRWGDRPWARREPGRAWHTWLTGLYPYARAPQDVWQPGGPLVEAMSRLELRGRGAR